MPVVFDAVATGHITAGPNTDTLSASWTHTPVGSPGVILVCFQYNTTVPATKSIVNTVTSGGHALTPLVPPMGQRGKGWGTPKKGWVEVWGGVGAAAAGGTIAVGLNYNAIAGDPLSPAHATFSNFSGTSLTYIGANTLPDLALKKGITGRIGSGRLISVGVSAFMSSLSVIVVGSDGIISEDAPHANSRFLDSGGNLYVGDHQGPGTVRVQNSGGNFGAVVINLQPI